jgi:chorismate--pyruvate lyase
MRSACDGGFKLALLSQVRTRPLPREARILNFPQRRFALIREVLLCCRDVPWIFARSVLPLATLQGRYRRIAHLGAKPLGDVLFSCSGLKRGEIRVLPLYADPPMYAICTNVLGKEPVDAWMRQSVFELDRAPLLVSEVFLAQWS